MLPGYEVLVFLNLGGIFIYDQYLKFYQVKLLEHFYSPQKKSGKQSLRNYLPGSDMPCR
jgi:hypothetical protein